MRRLGGCTDIVQVPCDAINMNDYLLVKANNLCLCKAAAAIPKEYSVRLLVNVSDNHGCSFSEEVWLL